MKTYGLLWIILLTLVTMGMVCCVGELMIYTHSFENTLPSK